MLFLSSLAAKAKRETTTSMPFTVQLNTESALYGGSLMRESGDTLSPVPRGCLRAVGAAVRPRVWAGVGRR